MTAISINRFGLARGQKMSNYFIPTLKDDPAEAEVISHKLMIRAGFIRRLTSGIYSYLPLGLRSLKKVKQIIREEMCKAGALEILMPSVQPGELWKESGRWDQYGENLLKLKDRHNRDYVVGPTHEEVVTDLARREIQSWRQLPLNLYQIQTKFRDEIRPRFGLMRGREFIMKDAYSFDGDENGANISYQAMYDAYQRIFSRCGLSFAVVEADSGSIGGSYSHEFMVLAENGEDAIASCTVCTYAANLEKAILLSQFEEQQQDLKAEIEKIDTPNCETVEKLAAFMKISPQEIIKSMLFESEEQVFMLMIAGDREVNLVKLKNFLKGKEAQLLEPEKAAAITKGQVGYLGPLNLEVKILADLSVKEISKGVVGANDGENHLLNVVPGRDFKIESYADFALVKENDLCPKCNHKLEIKRGIEVGHVFKLGNTYSSILKAQYADQNGKNQDLIMGCYGIGVGRTLAAAIEQNFDQDGIIWPLALAPFEVSILPLQVKNEEVLKSSLNLFQQCLEAGLEVLLDDRDERAGSKFKDADLIGIPFRVALSEKSLANKTVELKIRGEKDFSFVKIDEIVPKLIELKNLKMNLI